MRWARVLVAVVALAGCSADPTGVTSTSAATTSSTSTPPSTTTTSTPERAVAGQLVKLDLERFEPVHGLEPIPLAPDSWILGSDDGRWMVVSDWNTVTPIDVDRWEATGTFDLVRRPARVIADDHLYVYDERSGRITSFDLRTGETAELGEWRREMQMDGQIRVMSGLLVGYGGSWVHWLDLATGAVGEIEVGPMERINEETGIYDGEYEIVETDTFGLAWGHDHLYIAHADPLEVIEVEPRSGHVQTHHLETTSWLDRLLAFWMPAAAAKGPSMGTYSSAALSADDRFLFVSGNRYDVVTNDDGSLVEENEHLGLIVVDTETWDVVARHDLAVQFVRNAGQAVLAIDTTVTPRWQDDYYVVSTDANGVVSYQGPFGVRDGGCEAALDGSHLICSEYLADTSQRLRVVDIHTSETTDGPDVGPEDYLDVNGVLVDWSPLES